jgi:hypothetical protein
MPALRRLSPEQYTAFRAPADELVRADERLSLFEWSLHQRAAAPPRPWFGRTQGEQATARRLAQLAEPLGLCSRRSPWAGSEDPAEPRRFAAGVAALGSTAPSGLAMVATRGLHVPSPRRGARDARRCRATEAPHAPHRLRGHRGERRQVLAAEGELLRAVADARSAARCPPLVAAA